MLSRKIIPTADGSHTLYVPELNEHYHSTHGAIQESTHVFIRNGIHHLKTDSITILEAGFGTGLNAYLTLVDACVNLRQIFYHTIEKYPLKTDEVRLLNYPNEISFPQPELFEKLHIADWDKMCDITPYFKIHKHRCGFDQVDFEELADIVFYDAFAPDVQPDLWEEGVLRRFFNALKPGRILVTYCVKGSVKQALRNIGFTIKRLPGPPGKHQMLQATKPHV